MQKSIDPRGKNVTYEVAFINVDEPLTILIVNYIVINDSHKGYFAGG